MILRARFVVPVDRPPIENGAVEVDGGRIVAVGPAGEVRTTDSIDYGEAVILPGLVNAHTHLELSDLAGRVPVSGGLADWLGDLMAALGEVQQDVQTVGQAVDAGLRQSLMAGVTCLGDITRHPLWVRPRFAASKLKVVSFGEVVSIGQRRHLLDERLTAAASLEYQSEQLHVGISPHAPYTVEPEALRTCADKARALGQPLCIHLAESPEEERFTLTGEGPLADHLRKVGVWDERIPVSGLRPVELAAACGVLGPAAVLAHANFISDDDLAAIGKSGASVAYCPRTHAAFGHPPHRFGDMLAAGVNVCIGTDSLASNPDLSVLRELRFLRGKFSDLPTQTIIEMGTIKGARALGFDAQVGSLTVGKAADLVVVPLPQIPGTPSWDAMLESDDEPTAVYLQGSEVRGDHG